MNEEYAPPIELGLPKPKRASRRKIPKDAPSVIVKGGGSIISNGVWNIDRVIAENEKRLGIQNMEYDPISGEGSFSVPRIKVEIAELGGTLYLPKRMIEENEWINTASDLGSLDMFIRTRGMDGDAQALAEELMEERIKYDFEFWAFTCVMIKPKLGGEDIPFRLNLPQRKFLQVLEDMRLNGEPIRVILLKSRQWGGSTLTQIYMAWIQLVHKTGWNSVIAAHQKDASANIKGMYSKVLANYPEKLLGQLKFVPFQRMYNCSEIKQRNCKVTIGSAENPDSVRGQDISMAHLSEVAFWRDSTERKATDVIRTITSSIPLQPLSLLVIESTANGVGDYFHTEWKRSTSEDPETMGDKVALFIAWYDDPANSMHVRNYHEFIKSWSLYEWSLWNKGATIEAIRWYRAKRREYISIEDMQAEYPSTALEAFKNSGKRVFDQEHVEKLRENVCPPKLVGEIVSSTHAIVGVESLEQLKFAPSEIGCFKVWKAPDSGDEVSRRYIVVVDAGGRSEKADWSVICVIDRMGIALGGGPEVVAQWRGHIDLDILAFKAAQIAKMYNNALLVIESNTFESSETEGDHGEFILDTLSQCYNNLYCRTDPMKIRDGAPIKYGFHTNRSTKTNIINFLVGLVRDCGYIEHDENTCNELDVYEIKQNGSFGAIDGRHDDCLMTRAIGLYVSFKYEQCYKRPKTLKRANERIVGVSSI